MTIKVKVDDIHGLYQEGGGRGMNIESSDMIRIKCKVGVGLGPNNGYAGYNMKIKNFNGENTGPMSNASKLGGLAIDQNTAGIALNIDATDAEIGANDVVYVNCSGTTAHGMRFVHGVGADGASPAIYFNASSTDFTQTALQVNQAGTGNIVDFLDGGSTAFKVTNGGQVYVPSMATDTGGTNVTIKSGQIIIDGSDKRLKTNFSAIDSPLQKVLLLNGIYFNPIDTPDANRQMGFIAQEVHPVAPELTFTNEHDGYMGVRYGNAVALLTEAIKELNEEVAFLRERISKLEKE